MCRDNEIPIIVFNIREAGMLLSVLKGEGTSTTVTTEDKAHG
jgi:uridylate kinase